MEKERIKTLKEKVIDTKMEEQLYQTYNRIRLIKYSDGTISITKDDYGDESFIYFYKDQLKELKKFIGEK